MLDFLQFLYWVACVFVSVLCVAGFAWGHSQSAAMSLLLPLCLSITFGSFLFLGLWKFRTWWHSRSRLAKDGSTEGLSQINSSPTENAGPKSSWLVFD